MRWAVRRFGAGVCVVLLFCALLFCTTFVSAGVEAEPALVADAGTTGPPAAPVPPRSLLSLPTSAKPAPPDEYRLRRASDGSDDLIYEASGFVARIARDGAVRFRDRHVTNLSLLPFLPKPGMRPGVPSLEDVLRGLGRRRGGDPNGPAPDPIANETLSPSTTFSRFRPDPREICQYPNPCFASAPVTLINVSGTLDITDELMRMAHQDPYRFQKARFLTATREMRIRMAGRAHAEDVVLSGAELPRTLERIGCDESLSPADRRAIIQALRAEIDVATPEGRAQGERIRRFLEQWDRTDGGARACPPN
jgi:hypothetical protein